MSRKKEDPYKPGKRAYLNIYRDCTVSHLSAAAALKEAEDNSIYSPQKVAVPYILQSLAADQRELLIAEHAKKERALSQQVLDRDDVIASLRAQLKDVTTQLGAATEKLRGARPVTFDEAQELSHRGVKRGYQLGMKAAAVFLQLGIDTASPLEELVKTFDRVLP